MPRCVPCMGTAIKQAVLEANEGLAGVLGKIADCPDPLDLSLCGTRAGKGKRPPSAYQLFIGQCMRSKGIRSFAEAPNAMRGCVEAWKQQRQ